MPDRVGARFFEGQAAVSIAVLDSLANAPSADESAAADSVVNLLMPDLLTAAERQSAARAAIPARRMATTLAGKAALLAAIGSPCRPAEFYPYVEVRRDHYGAPRFVFKAGCPLGAPGMATIRPHLSLSHDAPYALACAVVPEERRQYPPLAGRGQAEAIAAALRETLTAVLLTGEARRAFIDVHPRAVRGAGVDIVATGRLRMILEAQADVLPGLFTPAERAEADSAPCAAMHLAQVFAAKEAVFKTLQSAWPDDGDLLGIEVLDVARGLPRVTLRGGMAALARSRGIERFVTAVTPHQTYAAAAALATL